MQQAGTPALNALLASLDREIVFAQVLLRRHGAGFELRHVADRDTDATALRKVNEGELRAIAQFTSTGAFRPLKSAPNLQPGWLFQTANPAALDFALDQLYPGAVADWYVTQQGSAAVTPYRVFTARQTGMYRITTMLDDVQTAAMIRACCHVNFCLKRRLWSVEGLEIDAASAKSAIPCLEPCAILLEFARVAVRIEQSRDAIPGEATELIQTEPSLPEQIREADFSNPANPRRVQLEIEKAKVNGAIGRE
jgi:hypothetical protein